MPNNHYCRTNMLPYPHLSAKHCLTVSRKSSFEARNLPTCGCKSMMDGLTIMLGVFINLLYTYTMPNNHYCRTYMLPYPHLVWNSRRRQQLLMTTTWTTRRLTTQLEQQYVFLIIHRAMYDILSPSVMIGHNHKIMNLHCHHHITTYNNYLDTIDAAAADRELNITVTHRYIQAIFAIRTAYIVSTLDYSAN